MLYVRLPASDITDGKARMMERDHMKQLQTFFIVHLSTINISSKSSEIKVQSIRNQEYP